jgi:hypothetical protein
MSGRYWERGWWNWLANFEVSFAPVSYWESVGEWYGMQRGKGERWKTGEQNGGTHGNYDALNWIQVVGMQESEDHEES